MKRFKRIFILFYFLAFQINGQDSTKKIYQFSKIETVPNLSFFNQVYTGLDILEQMDFKPIKNKPNIYGVYKWHRQEKSILTADM